MQLWDSRQRTCGATTGNPCVAHPQLWYAREQPYGANDAITTFPGQTCFEPSESNAQKQGQGQGQGQGQDGQNQGQYNDAASESTRTVVLDLLPRALLAVKTGPPTAP